MGKPGPSHPADKDTMDMSQLFLARGKGQTSEHGGHSPPARGGQTWPTSPSTTPISVCVWGGGQGRHAIRPGPRDSPGRLQANKEKDAPSAGREPEPLCHAA